MNTINDSLKTGMVPAVISFIRLLREHGLQPGIQETIEVLSAAGTGML